MKKMKSSRRTRIRRVVGEQAWTISTSEVEASVTEQGGHLAPVTFDRKDKRIQPLAVSPWAEESFPELPPMLRVLRGDFFCLPFGGNDRPYRGETHPPHGETANGVWKLEREDTTTGLTRLFLSMETEARKGRVDKRIVAVQGHNAVYQQHVVSGMSGPMNPGHHAMLKFPKTEGSGCVSVSPFVYGQVCPEPFEDAAEGGYFNLKTGATFERLDQVPSRCGGFADLSRYPAREGWEDLVMMVCDEQLPFAWTAVSFPKERYVWFALKDPRVLRNTIFWMSNGGRHYAPWNGRHRRVMGLEEVTSYFHFGLAESAKKNPISKLGYPTVIRLSPKRPLVVNYIMAVARTPARFDQVREIAADKGLESVTLTSASGKKVKVTLDVAFLQADDLAG